MASGFIDGIARALRNLPAASRDVQEENDRLKAALDEALDGAARLNEENERLRHLLAAHSRAELAELDALIQEAEDQAKTLDAREAALLEDRRAARTRMMAGWQSLRDAARQRAEAAASVSAERARDNGGAGEEET